MDNMRKEIQSGATGKSMFNDNDLSDIIDKIKTQCYRAYSDPTKIPLELKERFNLLLTRGNDLDEDLESLIKFHNKKLKGKKGGK